MTHGTDDKVIVCGDDVYTCGYCGMNMVVALGPSKERTRIRCVNQACSHYDWILVRPDLYSCEVISKPAPKPPIPINNP
jgi:hypothetical protein